ncbi:hypothetical protein HMPREF1548_04983 [Clostridium sp. KLE 1755]|nr:hypothetical protein HMPREF1548_04983 [Clostridium sp. KLE 1755]
MFPFSDSVFVNFLTLFFSPLVPFSALCHVSFWNQRRICPIFLRQFLMTSG